MSALSKNLPVSGIRLLARDQIARKGSDCSQGISKQGDACSIWGKKSSLGRMRLAWKWGEERRVMQYTCHHMHAAVP